MPSAYSFIDLAVLDDVRERFARGEAVAILSADLDQVIWVNGRGAKLFGEVEIDAAIGASPGLGSPARRQIMATSGYPDIGRDRTAVVRLTSGMDSRVVRFVISGVSLPDGEPAIILAQPSEQASPEMAISGLSGPGQFAAVVDASGGLLAGSEGFAALRLEADVLAALASETSPAQRVVKRVITGANAAFPAGLARLTDDPASFLLIVVDEAGAAAEGDESEATAHAAEPDAAVPASSEGAFAAELAGEAEPPAWPDAAVELDTRSPTVARTAGASDLDEFGQSDDGADVPAQPRAVALEPEPFRPAVQVNRAAEAIRFVWRTDAAGRFSTISPEFGEAVGHEAADVLGRSFGEVASAFGLDSGHEVGGLLERRDTWSGRTVFWPIAGAALRVPVDLAALPVYNRDRVFEGFRGFGVVRLADVVADPQGAGLALVARGAGNSEATQETAGRDEGPADAAHFEDPFQGEVPALAVAAKPERRPADKVIRLAERRPALPEKGLSPVERSAFREIGERLRRDRSEAREETLEAAASQRETGDANAAHSGSSTAIAQGQAGPDVPQRLENASAEASPEAEASLPLAADGGPTADGAAASEPELADPVHAPRRRKRRIAFRYEHEFHTHAHDEQTHGRSGDEDAAPAATADHDAEAQAAALRVGATGTQRDSAGTVRPLEQADPETPDQDAPEHAAAAANLTTEAEFAILMAAAQRPDGADGVAADPLGNEAAALGSGRLPANGGDEAGAEHDDLEHRLNHDDGPEGGEFTGEAGHIVASLNGWGLRNAASEAPGDSAQQPGSDPEALEDPEPVVVTPTPADLDRAAHPGVADDVDAAPNTFDSASGEPPFSDSNVAAAAGLGPHDFDAAALDEAGHASPAFEQPEVAAATGWAGSAPQPNAVSAYAIEPDSTGPASPTFPDVRNASEERLDTGMPLRAESLLAGLTGTRGSEQEPLEQRIIDRLPVPILIHAGDTLYYANPEFLYLTGYPTLNDLRAAGGLGALFAEPYADDGDAQNQVMRLRTGDGLEFPIEALLRSVSWNNGTALMLVVRRTGEEPSDLVEEPSDTVHQAGQAMGASSQAVEAALQSRDLPRDTAASHQLAELQARFAEMRTIMDTATDGVVLIRPDGTIRSISRPAEALFGSDSSEVEGKPFTSLFAIESQRAARDYLAGLAEHGVASVLNDGREVIGREAEGRFIPLFMTIGKLPEDGGYCAVMRDITQWKRAEEELTQAKTLAERASSQKTEFLARISHEIRTPLNAIIGFSELMMDERFGPVGSDRYRDYLRDINRSGNHVLDLVNDLLDISKIEAGQQEMNYEAVSLNETLAETVAMMQPQANRERVIIRSSFASKLPEVVADLRSVRQIALNILSNAIRYTQAGGQVIVSTAYEPSGDIVLRVRDTGIGMSNAEIEQALKPFKQINALKRGRGDGTGLGLPLTKAMVEANRARFTIASTPGEGTLVEVTFPATRVLAG